MTRRGYQHVTKIAGFTVTDGTAHILRCEACEAPLLSSDEVAGFERRAAMQILMTAEKPVSGAVLKYARKSLGLRQKEMAELLDTNEQQISRWENDPEIGRKLRLAVAGLLAMPERGVAVGEVAATPGSKFEIRKAG